jgi:putative ABC transport system ATP-binding protein
MVFQNFNLFPHFSVLRNLTDAPACVQKRDKAELKKEAASLLEKMGLAGKEHAYPCELSGGQQQRVAIARAVVSNPKLILADEPTGNLDSKNGKEVMDLLTELNKEGTTIVMVTHSQKDAACAQRIVNLFDGQIVSDVKNEL